MNSFHGTCKKTSTKVFSRVTNQLLVKKDPQIRGRTQKIKIKMDSLIQVCRRVDEWFVLVCAKNVSKCCRCL
jgi:hypothetical protein